MTKEEWGIVEHRLSNPYGSVDLVCDGYKLHLHTSIYKMRVNIMFYVDGKWLGRWILEDCEERRRFHRCVVHKCYGPAEKKKYLKLGKAFLKRMAIDLDKTWVSYRPDWGSFRSLKAHLIKNNTSIELAPEAP